MNGDDLLGSHAATVLDSEQSTANDSSQLTTESVISESPNKNVEIAITKSEFDDKGGFLVLHPASNIETGDYILEIDYEVPIDGYAIVETNKSAQWELFFNETFYRFDSLIYYCYNYLFLLLKATFGCWTKTSGPS